MEGLMRQDYRQGRGFCLIDPLGPLATRMMTFIAAELFPPPNRVVYIAPHRNDWSVCYDLLTRRPGDKHQPDPWFQIKVMKLAAVKAWGAEDTRATTQIDEALSMAFFTATSLGLTLYDVAYLLDSDLDRNPLRRAVAERIMPLNSGYGAMWQRISDYIERKRPEDYRNEVGTSTRRLRAFVDDPRMARMFSIPGKSIDLRKLMDEGAIIIADLSPGKAQFHREDSQVFGTFLLADFFVRMFHRERTDQPFTVYIDEFQNYVSPDLTLMLDMARNFGLRFVLAHQRPGQLLNRDPDLYSAVRTNTRTKVIFGGVASDELEPIAKDISFGVLDPRKIKQIMTAPTVTRYVKEYWEAHAETEAMGYSQSKSEMSSRGTGLLSAEGLSADGIRLFQSASQSFQNAHGMSTGNVSSRALSFGRSEIPVLVPVIEERISALYYENLDEQMYQFLAILHDQKERHAMVRIGDADEIEGIEPGPVPIKTEYVSNAPIDEEEVEAAILGTFAQNDCFMRVPEADAIIAGRRGWLEKEFGGGAGPIEVTTGEDTLRATSEVASCHAIMLEPMIQQISTMKIRVEDLELQPRDIRLLLDLFEGRIIRIREAAALYYDGSDDVAKRRLRYMAEAGLLKDVPNKSEKGKPPVVYAFAVGAFRLLTEHGVLQGFSPKEWDQKLRKRFTMAASTLEHELAILEVRAAMVPAIDTHPGHKVMEFGTWPEAFAFKTKLVEEGKVRTVTQKPDGYLCIAKHGLDGRRAFLHFFIEVDRGTEELKTLASKAERYREHYRSGGFADWLGQPRGSYRAHPFRVLMVLPSSERAANVARAIGASKQVWISTHQDVRTNPLGAIWTVPGISTERRCALLDDPSSP
jgi:hypothetical protein